MTLFLLRMISTALLALAVLFAVAAVISLFRGDAFMMHTEVMTSPAGGPTTHQRAVTSWRGGLSFAYVRADLVEESARHGKRLRLHHRELRSDQAPSRMDAPASAAWIGFDWRRRDRTTNDPQEGLYIYRERFLTVPYWLIVVACAGLGWWIGARPRLIRRRHRQGLCLACGYDLRETPGRCPECGGEPMLAARWSSM